MKNLLISLFLMGSIFPYVSYGSSDIETPRFCEKIYTPESHKVCAKILFYSEQLDTSDYGGELYISDRREVKERIAEIAHKVYQNERFMRYHEVDENFTEKLSLAKSIFFMQTHQDMPFIQIYTLSDKGQIHRFKLDGKNIAIDWFFNILDISNTNDAFNFSKTFGFHPKEKLLTEHLF